MRPFFLCAALTGTALPWFFFASWFAGSTPTFQSIIAALFPNGLAAGFTTDILISMAVFWVWSWHDARQIGLRHWWVVLPAGFCVGLSLALPLYLYKRTAIT